MSSQPNHNCIVYCRVSTAKSAQEGESLDTQAAICRSFIAGRGLTIVPDGKVFRETFSGRADRRPVLDEVFDYLRRHRGEVRYFVFRVIDRFTRGGGYSYEKIKQELARLGVEMIDTHGVIQPAQNTLAHVGFEYAWSKTSPSEITEMVLATSAKAEVTSILTRLIGREIELTQQGYKVHRADDGYLNRRIYIDGKRKVIQIPDPARAHFFVEMFRLRAEGALTDRQIVERINALGYRSRTWHRWDAGHEQIIGRCGGVPLSVKRLQEIIQRPIYCGVVHHKWTRRLPIQAQYAGLVDLATFNRANRGKVFIQSTPAGLQILYNHRPEKLVVKRSRHNPLFPYKHLVLCPLCRRPFWGSSPQGRSGQRFPAYHCSRGHRYLGIPKQRFDATVEGFIQQLRFKPEAFRSVEAMLRRKYQERQGELERLTAVARRTVADLQTEQQARVDAFSAATSPVLRARLEQEVEQLEARIKAAQGATPKMAVTEGDIAEFVAHSRRLLEHLPETLLRKDISKETQRILSLVFDSQPTYDELATGTAKQAWIFKVLSEPSGNGSFQVHTPGLGWNDIETTILKWKEFFQMFPLPDHCNTPKQGIG